VAASAVALVVVAVILAVRAARVHNGVIYVGSEDSFIYALSTKDGAEIWRHKLDVAVTIFSGNAPITVAP